MTIQISNHFNDLKDYLGHSDPESYFFPWEESGNPGLFFLNCHYDVS